MGGLISSHKSLYIERLNNILFVIFFFCIEFEEELLFEIFCFLTTCFTAVTCLDEELLLHAHAIILIFFITYK